MLAAVIAAVLTIVGLLEAFRYRDPRLHPIFLIEPGDRDAVRLWTVNVGFYNITMAAGLATGLFLVSRGYLTEGRTLVLFVAAAHVFLGAVLLVSERRLWASALGQAVPSHPARPHAHLNTAFLPVAGPPRSPPIRHEPTWANQGCAHRVRHERATRGSPA